MSNKYLVRHDAESQTFEAHTHGGHVTLGEITVSINDRLVVDVRYKDSVTKFALCDIVDLIAAMKILSLEEKELFGEITIHKEIT